MHDSRLLAKVKTCLRTTTAKFDDDEIAPLIEAAYIDMQGAGVDIKDESKAALIQQAVVFYCKAYFGLAPLVDWQKKYEALRDAIATRVGDNY